MDSSELKVTFAVQDHTQSSKLLPEIVLHVYSERESNLTQLTSNEE